MNETTDSPSDEDEPYAARTTRKVLDLINFGNEHNMAQSPDWDLSEVRQQTSLNIAKQHRPLLHDIQSLVGPHYHLKTAILQTWATATVEIRDQHMDQHSQHRNRTKYYEIDQPVGFSSSKSTSGCFALCRGIRDHSGTFQIRDSLTSHC